MTLLFLPFKRSDNRFEQLVAPHIESLYKLAYRFTGSQHDAEDLVQELLIKLYPRSKQLESIELLKPWLSRSLYNLYIDTLRRHERSAESRCEHDSDAILLSLPSTESEPEQEMEAHARQKELQHALQQLDDERRHLVILHDMEGFTLNELSQILEQPIGTLKSRLHRARQQLRQFLEMEPSATKRRVSG